MRREATASMSGGVTFKRAYYHIRHANGVVARTLELAPGHLMVDLRTDGRILGIEVIGEHDPLTIFHTVLHGLVVNIDAGQTSTDQETV